MSTISGRLEAFRALRAEAEASILPLARSVDGRNFSLQSKLEGLELRLGGYVVLEGEGESALGQIRALDAVEIDAGEVGLGADGEGGVDVRARLPLRVVRGEGVILDRGGTPFNDRMARPASAEEVGDWLARVAPSRARLDVGTMSLAGGVPASLDAGGFDRHTFLCGQSGSGKSYSLGLTLERLLLETQLRIIVIDPNSDCVRLPELRADADDATAARWREIAGSISSAFTASEKRASTEYLAAERRTASISMAKLGFLGSARKPTRRNFGATASNNSRYFSLTSATKLVRPVTIPPGRAKLAANPAATRSPPLAWTIGVPGAALDAALTARPDTVTMTAGFLFARSSASAWTRSVRPSAQRSSRMKFAPSFQSNTASPPLNAANRRSSASREPMLSHAIRTGCFDCARTVRGVTAIAASRNKRSRRRFTRSPESPATGRAAEW